MCRLELEAGFSRKHQRVLHIRTSQVARLEGHFDYSFACAWHPDGNLVATGNQVSYTCSGAPPSSLCGKCTGPSQKDGRVAGCAEQGLAGRLLPRQR